MFFEIGLGNCNSMFLLHIVLALTLVFTSGLRIFKGLPFIISSKSTRGEEGNRNCFQ